MFLCYCFARRIFLSRFFFFFKQKTAYEMRISDWSSDVCSSDLVARLSKIIALSPEDIERFEQERKANRSFRAVTLKLRLSADEVARFAVDQWRFPGVSVEPYLTRRYPYGALMAHIVGYVGRTDENDIEQYGPGQALFTHTGRSGIERYYDKALRGEVGYEEVKTNV